MKLNRLDADRLRKAQTLRERALPCQTSRARRLTNGLRNCASLGPSPMSGTIIRRIFEQYPDPPDLPPRNYDVHDRRVARVAILRKIRPVCP